MSTLISALLSLLSSGFGYFFKKKQITLEAQNSPVMVANTAARDEVKRTDEVEQTVQKATQGHEPSLDEIRRLAGN